ncbi:MAG: hypothetical protein FWE82_05880 [Defluviitaleaceae bacterium]|nr:hypothetical protein [Defluviitaleaceae bacterium]
MKTVNFFGSEVTRLIIGDNPFCGHSYIENEHSGNEMMDFYTAGKVVETLFRAEEYGINAYMALADGFIIRCLRQYRNEGGKMKIMFQSYPPVELETNLHQMMSVDPIAIYHQGGTFDLLFEEGRFDMISKRLALIKSAGVAAGFGTHVPEVIKKAEEEGWEADFYMACLYNARRTQRGMQSGFITGKPKQLVFYPEDPPFMYEAVRAAKKPCIVFKIFAGGQIFTGMNDEEKKPIIKKVFEDVYTHIKPIDLACIGVFQKYSDQLKSNVGICDGVLG